MLGKIFKLLLQAEAVLQHVNNARQNGLTWSNLTIVTDRGTGESPSPNAFF